MSYFRAFTVSALLVAGPARAATLLVPDFTDNDPEEALRLRLLVLKAVGSVRGLTVAPLFKFKKLAKAAQLDPADLANSAAAQALSKDGLDAVLGGSVEETNGRRLLHIQLFDGAGQLVYRRETDVTDGSIRPDQVERIAHSVAAALHIEESDSGAKSSAAQAPAETPPPQSPAIDTAEPADPTLRHRRTAPPKNDETTPAPEAASETEARYEDPAFELALGGIGGSIALATTNEKLLEPCNSVGGPGCYTSLSSSFYLGLGGQLQTFPWHANTDWLAGLGAIASASFAPTSFAGGNSNGTFSASDLRFDGALAYRLRLPLFSGDAAIFSPSLGARVGVSLWNFDVGQNSYKAYSTDRLALPALGAEVLEPFGHYVRLILGGTFFLTPYPGSAAETALASVQTYADGFQLEGELEGHLGTPNASAFTAHFKFDFTHFDDCYVEASGQGCFYKDAENYLSATLLVGYAFY